jgi:transcription termination factor NusB
MANRHLSRSIVLQSLFEWDLNAIERKAVIEVLDRNIEVLEDYKKTPEKIHKLLTQTC